jgi:Dolichyl-phosphate-mannose-protein mannosyltransferase
MLVRAVRFRSTLPTLLALLITAYGAVLRLNVIASRYGPIERPAWARVLTANAAAAAPHVEPGMYAWPPEPDPYVGGDPLGYLKFARQMRSFYQGHVREPVFLAWTRLWLWLLRDQDVGISFASASMSTLTIPLTCLLGTLAFSPAVGLLAAAALAIDYDAVSWSADGWRDDTFTCMVVLALCAMLWLRRHPHPRAAVLTGIAAAAACLTRITSVSWIVPALALLAFECPRERRRRATLAGIAAATMLVLVAPYLINCWRVSGDPFIAIDAHTTYYRAGEGLPFRQPESALAYIGAKLQRRPVFQLDTALTGLFVFPFENKWSGFNLWLPGLSTALAWLAVAGLVLFLASPTGRFLLLVEVASLLPYAFTWNVAGGSEWRFTMHVYPILLVAAFYPLSFVVHVIATRSWQRITRRRAMLWIATAAVLAGGVGFYLTLPYSIARESLQYGDSTSIETGPRDAVFYRGNWSDWVRGGAITSRIMLGDRARIRFPLPQRRAYKLTLRLDPALPDKPRVVSLLLNGRLLQPLTLTWDATRMGSYLVDLPAEYVRVGENELQLIADAVVPARAAGPRFASVPPDVNVSLRLWYIRVHPV